MEGGAREGPKLAARASSTRISSSYKSEPGGPFERLGAVIER